MPLVIYCADIGSVKRRNFGWAGLDADARGTGPETGCDIEGLVEGVAGDLNTGARVALGFECPLFVPVPDDPKELTSGRPGEGDRPWSAGAGAGSLTVGLTETVWILDQVRRRTTAPPEVYVDWPSFQGATSGLFIWEAFVTKTAKAETHIGDAELAVLRFRACLPHLERHNSVKCGGRVRSLLGAALLQTGWVTEPVWLTAACIVIRTRPTESNPMGGA